MPTFKAFQAKLGTVFIGCRVQQRYRYFVEKPVV